MKKTVLLGIAAVVLSALPVFAGETKWDPVPQPCPPIPWPGSWSYTAQEVARLDVKMLVPFYVHIVNQDAIWLQQVECGTIGKDAAKDKDWPCFKGCLRPNETPKGTEVKCNFNIVLSADVANKSITCSGWDKSITPSNITAPGQTGVEICVWAWNCDLTNQPAATEKKVAELVIKVKPQ